LPTRRIPPPTCSARDARQLELDIGGWLFTFNAGYYVAP
jgi:hypothetical protein